MPAGLLCLEITESGFVEDPAHTQKVLDRLSGMGLRLAIDDFGVGYSSLSYLMKLPVQELKIDRSFIAGMATEGVEDGHGWDLLETLGCDDAQGYFISPPLEPAVLLEWMQEHDGVDIRTQPRRVGSTMGGFRGA